MARFLSHAVLFSIIALSTIPAGAESGITASPASGDTVATSMRNGLEQESFLLVNQYRQAAHLPPLEWDGIIAKVARGHSRDMAVGDVDFGHDGFGQRVTELRKTIVGVRGAGENVLKTDDPDQVAQKAVDLWLKSPHHLANIRGDFNYSGMGVWIDNDGVIYFTQIFIKTQPVVQAAQVAPSPLVTPFGFLATPKTRPSQ